MQDSRSAKCDNNTQNNSTQECHFNTAKSKETKFVNVSERQDILVVDFGVVEISEIDFFHFEQENVTAVEFVVFAFLQKDVCCFFQVFGKFRILSEERNYSISNI